MRFFCGKNRGAISVFLTLILVPVLIFSGIIVDIRRGGPHNECGACTL